MENTGWIKTYRSILKHWIWEEKPFSKGQAWIDMLLLASHVNSKFVLGGELVETPKGSFVTSEVKLMKRWGWSKSKTRLFLKMLEKDKMIVKKSDRKKTTITIVKYNSFQEIETTKKPQKDHRETTERPLKDTIKNIENVKEYKESSNAHARTPLLFEIQAYVDEQHLNVDVDKFFLHYSKNNWTTQNGKPITDWQRLLKQWSATEKKEPAPYPSGYGAVNYLGDD